MQNHRARNNGEGVVLKPADSSRAQTSQRGTSSMTVYAIAQLKMTDRAAYDRYQARFFDVFRKFGGRLLSADEQPAVLEGKWDRDKLVLMSFPDEAAFHAWANSPEYLEISKDRKAGAEAIVLLAKGFSP
jgi:uncharacterized protein (DUF1330 family)